MRLRNYNDYQYICYFKMELFSSKKLLKRVIQNWKIDSARVFHMIKKFRVGALLIGEKNSFSLNKIYD